jgi:hypothetical protein
MPAEDVTVILSPGAQQIQAYCYELGHQFGLPLESVEWGVDLALPCKPCHHFLYSGGAFVRLYPVNLTPTRNHAAKPKRRPRGRYRFALDMW